MPTDPKPVAGVGGLVSQRWADVADDEGLEGCLRAGWYGVILIEHTGNRAARPASATTGRGLDQGRGGVMATIIRTPTRIDSMESGVYNFVSHEICRGRPTSSKFSPAGCVCGTG